jgi:hypothetical protein
VDGSSRDRIAQRRPLEGHVGESGAVLELATLDGSVPVVLKHFDLDSDLLMRISDDVEGRAAALWASGALDGLPPSVDHTILDAWREEERWTVMMRDVSSGLISLDRKVSTSEVRRVIAAATDLHAAYWGEHVEGAATLRCRMELMSPQLMRAHIDAPLRLPGWIVEGWEAFFDLVRDDVAAAVRTIHEDVEPLAAELERGGTTLLHGDLWLQNVALLDDRVALIDWALATQGPPAVEWGYFLGVNWWQTELTHEELLAIVREEEGERLPDRDLQLGLLWAFASYGWNKAWHAVHNEDPVTREHERDDLAWWTAAARSALEMWSPA